MGTYILIAVLVFIWITLNKQIGGVETKIDSLKKEIETLKKTVHTQEEETESSPVSTPVHEAEVIPPPPPYFPENKLEVVAVEEEEKSSDILCALEAETDISDNGDKDTCIQPPVPPMVTQEEKNVLLQTKKKNINYEKYIGENVFGKIGILVLVIGVGLFVKYAIDRDWINEIFRTVLGFLTGSILLFVAERLQKKYHTFSSLLAGGAFAIFYVTVAVAFHFYGIFSQLTAFILLLVITVLMSILSMLYDRRELAVIALVGGFIAPFLVSRGGGNYIVLFNYLTILNLGMFGLSLRKKWPELPIISFVFTYLIMFIYTWQIDVEYVNGEVAFSVSHLFIRLLIFATMFYFVFLLPVVSILKNEKGKINKVLLWVIVGNNFIYIAFGLYYLSNILSPVRQNGLLTLFVALVNLVLVLWLRRKRQNYHFLIYTLLGLVLTFVSITVPIQLTGNYITLFWAAEMVLLLWLYVKSKIRVYEYFAVLMVIGTLFSCIMDMDYALINDWWQDTMVGSSRITYSGTMFFNGIFSTVAFAGICFLLFAFIIQKNKAFFETGKIIKYYHWNVVTLFIAIVLLYFSVANELYKYLPVGTGMQAIYLFTAACILLLSYLFRNRFPIKQFLFLYNIGIAVSVGIYLFDVWCGMPSKYGTFYLPWLTTLVTAAILFYIGRLYYGAVKYNSPVSNIFTVYLNVAAVFFWLAVVNRFLAQLNLPDEFNAGFSIALAIAGFIQMSLGMRLHWKVMRVISLFTFGLVLLKLVLLDLWAMPTVGKILVFIMLGVILLVLSFLYQKLKDVLFKNDTDGE